MRLRNKHRLQYPLRQPNGVAQYKGCQAHLRPLFHQIKLQRLLQSHRNPTNKAAPHLRRHRVGTRNPLLYHPTLRNIHSRSSHTSRIRTADMMRRNNGNSSLRASNMRRINRVVTIKAQGLSILKPMRMASLRDQYKAAAL